MTERAEQGAALRNGEMEALAGLVGERARGDGGAVLPMEAEDAPDKKKHIPASTHNPSIIVFFAFACAGRGKGEM